MGHLWKSVGREWHVPRRSVNNAEIASMHLQFDYTTIWIIVAAMTYFDFVIGIGVGSESLLSLLYSYGIS